MKKLLLLFIPLVFFFGCEKEDPSADINDNNTTGYNCSPVSGDCVESADGFYLNLEDCENECWCVDGDLDNDGICDGEYDDDYCLDCVPVLLNTYSESWIQFDLAGNPIFSGGFDWDEEACGSFYMPMGGDLTVCDDEEYDEISGTLMLYINNTSDFYYCPAFNSYWSGTIEYYYDCQ